MELLLHRSKTISPLLKGFELFQENELKKYGGWIGGGVDGSLNAVISRASVELIRSTSRSRSNLLLDKMIYRMILESN